MSLISTLESRRMLPVAKKYNFVVSFQIKKVWILMTLRQKSFFLILPKKGHNLELSLAIMHL